MKPKENLPILHHDIAKVINLAPPKAHRGRLPQATQDLLQDVEDTLRNEIRKCLRVLAQLVVGADEYHSISVRLAGFLRDYMKLSGADESEFESKEIKKAIISVESYVSKQLRAQALSTERERRKEAEERHLRHIQPSDEESESLEALGKLGDLVKEEEGFKNYSGGEGHDSEGAILRRQVAEQEQDEDQAGEIRRKLTEWRAEQENKQESVDSSEQGGQDSFDADGLFQI